MPEEQERTRVSRLLTEADRGIEEIKTAIGSLNRLPQEQSEALKFRLDTISEKIGRADTDHKKFCEEARQLKAKYEEMIRKEKDQITKDREAIIKLQEEKRALEEGETIAALIEQIKALKEEIDKLCAPPHGVGTVHEVESGGRVWIYASGRRIRVEVKPGVEINSLRPGQEVVLNEVLNIIEPGRVETQGEVVTVEEFMEDGLRIKIKTELDKSRIAQLAEYLKTPRPKVGDLLLYDPRSGYCVERLPKNEAQDLLLFEVPTTTYADIGALGAQIEKIRDAVELPFTHTEEFAKFKLQPPKGVLLYGPPGCGKTLIAKAIASSLAKAVEKKTGKPTQGFFINIKGPELLTKWVGESERKIREIFQRAREKASEGMPVIIFFDEIESLLRTRGSGISSDVESTIVPQFLAEIDGVESLKNVIVLGASNRQDLIDPAVLRSGRFDVKVKIDRPDKQGAKEIFTKYLTPDLPLHPKYTNEQHSEFRKMYRDFKGDPAKIVEYQIDRVTARMWTTDKEPFTYKLNGQTVQANNKIMKITKRDGTVEYLYVKDFASGAMIQNIVTRAKKRAVKRKIADGEVGLKTEDLCWAVEEEINENQDLPNTSAGAEEWLRMQGYREGVVNSQLVDRKEEKTRPVEKVTTGQYL